MSKAPTFLNKLEHRLRSSWEKYRLNKNFPDSRISHIKQVNRQNLALISNWIDESAMKESVFNYGIPNGQEYLLNREIDDHTSYSDLLGYLAMQLKSPINYLEIGVSVGKNLWQMCNLFSDATLTGIDVEKINPAVAAQFESLSTLEWEGNTELMRPKSSTSSFQYQSNKIVYHCMDVFDKEGWNQLGVNPFNVIFSDAFHDPAAILHEFNMLNHHSLISRENFVMMWDDLGGDMTLAFDEIYRHLKKDVNDLRCHRFITNGWMNFKYHQVGIITNINFR